ncbi:MAG: type II toxin-antitoxin system HicA family toxin [Clostridia bacterium]|jgi:predicted RNA binding protein YcfA (HicA-like mRNA interferase family)|nr:type II toxin-antitoxin system HicA family toxin [Clostridia bacterium]MCI9413216.1 type II toxin-antitoxin system HicA family toxin [Clostridia bacterium]
MSSKYPVLPPKRIIKVLEKYGFEKVAQKGSHVKYKNKITGVSYIIPMHSEIAKGTLKSILEQAHVELKDFLKYLSSFLF